MERATRAGDALDTLLRLFVIGTPVSGTAASTALAPVPVDALAASGVVAVDGDADQLLIARDCSVDPSTWWWLTTSRRPWLPDRDRPCAGRERVDHGARGGDHPSPTRAAFDLGSGGGVQALARRRQPNRGRIRSEPTSGRVLHLDHGAQQRLECLGVVRDLFEPVADDTFELIVANPPFVISPSRQYLYRDARPHPVDDLCRALVRSAPTHLTDGGHCQLLALWAHVKGEDGATGWRAGSRYRSRCARARARALDPSVHAASWLRQTEAPARPGSRNTSNG